MQRKDWSCPRDTSSVARKRSLTVISYVCMHLKKNPFLYWMHFRPIHQCVTKKETLISLPTSYYRTKWISRSVASKKRETIWCQDFLDWLYSEGNLKTKGKYFGNQQHFPIQSVRRGLWNFIGQNNKWWLSSMFNVLKVAPKVLTLNIAGLSKRGHK